MPSNASPTTQRLHEYLSLLDDLKTKGMSTDHPQVKTLDAELQPRLIDAQNRKYPGIDLSLLSVKEQASEFTSQLLNMPEGGKWRAVVNTETRESSGDNLVDHAVAVEVFRQGDQLSVVILEGLSVKDRCVNLADAARYIKDAAVSIVLTEVQKGYSGCKIHALHHAVQMYKAQDAVSKLHAENFAALTSDKYDILDQDTFSKVKRGIDFLPAEFFENVTSRKTFDKLPGDVKDVVRGRFEKNYTDVWNSQDQTTVKCSIAIDKERMQYAQLALQS